MLTYRRHFSLWGPIVDRTADLLANYASSLTYEDLTPEAAHHVRRRLLDSLGCALGAYDSEPARIARQLAGQVSHTQPAHVIGSGQATSPDMAAFANAVMVRYLDCNDNFFSVAGGHPSDMIPAALAVADSTHSSGAQAMTAIAVAYQAFCSIADQIPLGELGWDQGVLAALGSACAAANLMRLPPEQTREAISLAVTPNMALGQTRVGELSMWKGCATAAAARAGVFAAMLAREGMSGPPEPFEGRRGLWEQLGWSADSELLAMGHPDGRGGEFKVVEPGFKYFPSQIHTQAAIWMALALRDKVAPDQIDSVHLETYHQAWSSAGNDPNKWDPRTRETADHSLPYLIAVALTDGEVTPASFDDERLHDPALRPLMAKISVSERADYTERYPEAQPSTMTLTTLSGERIVEESVYPKGHPRNPLTDAEVEEKFHRLAGRVLAQTARVNLVEQVGRLETLPDLGVIFDLTSTTSG